MHRYDVDTAPTMPSGKPPPRCASRSPVRAIAVALAAAGCALYGVARYQGSPEYRVHQFVASSRRGDAGGMFSLVGAAEARHLGLTQAKLQALLGDAAGQPGGVVLADPQWEPLNDRQSLYNCWARVMVYGGSPPQQQGSTGRPLTAIMQAYKTDDGWRIGASSLVMAILVARTGSVFGPGGYAALCRRRGVPPEVYDPTSGRWEEVPSRR